MSHEAAHCEIKPSNIEASQVLDVAFCCDSCNMLNLDDNSFNFWEHILVGSAGHS